jgi:restriction endonuclease S subunit
LIRSQNVHNDGFRRGGLAYIGDHHASELANVEVQDGDVLLNITGDSVARACQVDPEVLPARVNQHVAIIRPRSERLNPRFLRYLLVAPEMQTKLLSWAGAGGTRDALTKSMIEALDVWAPTDIAEQHAIADVLGTLDDKINLNRRMNETLEAMARALFKSLFLVATERTITRKGVEESATQMIPRLASVIVARGATTGRMVLLGAPMAMNQTCYALVSTSDTPFALYCRLRAEVEALVQAAHGSVFDTITTSTFESSRTVWAPVALMKLFEERAASFFCRLLSNVHESRTLTSLRDALLPKLISGELRIKDAEKIAVWAL